jgi:hypothetical protein
LGTADDVCDSKLVDNKKEIFNFLEFFRDGFMRLFGLTGRMLTKLSDKGLLTLSLDGDKLEKPLPWVTLLNC